MKFRKKTYKKRGSRQQHSPEYVAELRAQAEKLVMENPAQAAYIWKALDISLNP